MHAELRRCAVALSVAGVVAAATSITAIAEIAPAPVTPVGELAPSQPVNAASEWVTVPFAVAPATSTDQAGSERPTASARSLQVSPLGMCISCTDVGSGGQSAHSHAGSLTVLGIDVSGGEGSGRGSRGGALVMVPANPLLGLAIAAWMADTRADGSAHSRASLVDIAVGPRSHGRRAGAGDDRGEGAVTMSVVESKSDSTVDSNGAGGTGDVQQTKSEKGERKDRAEKTRKTSGKAETNAVDAGTGDDALALALAHSDSSGDGQGKAYVAGVNKGELVSSQQTGEGIPVEVPGITDVVLVQKTATDGTTDASLAKIDAPPADTGSTRPTGQVAATAAGVTSVPAATEVSGPDTGSVAATPVTGVLGVIGIPSTGVAMSLGGLGTLLVIIGAAILGVSTQRGSATR